MTDASFDLLSRSLNGCPKVVCCPVYFPVTDDCGSIVIKIHLESLKNKHSKASKCNSSDQLKSHQLGQTVFKTMMIHLLADPGAKMSCGPLLAPIAPSVQYVSCHFQVNKLNRNVFCELHLINLDFLHRCPQHNAGPSQRSFLFQCIFSKQMFKLT